MFHFPFHLFILFLCHGFAYFFAFHARICVLLVCFRDEWLWNWRFFVEMQVEVAEPLSKLGLEFPDIYIGIKSLTCLILLNFSEHLKVSVLTTIFFSGCYRKSRQGPIIICLKGKVQNTKRSGFIFFPLFWGFPHNFLFYRIMRGLT